MDPFATPPAGRPVRSRARRLAGSALALLLLGASVTAVVRSASAEGGDAPQKRPVATTAPSSTTTTVDVPPEEEFEAGSEQDAPVPVDPTPPKPLVQLGEIRIAKIGLVHPIYEGVALDVVDHGPGHWPGSAVPGQLGNSVFAGHRVTHSHPFRDLDQVAPGDDVVFSTRHGEFNYRVTAQEIVSYKDTWIVKPTTEATLTLFACHPPGSARQRIVVRGILTSSILR